jgi:7,8-dihydropterin-6-yl-methyl-4-(beta-D-ribofuranosyl)aminobenzene 5'-phosphate synthase
MGKMALGTVKSLSVTCLSELSWHDNARMRLDVREAGGLQTADQFDVKWTPGNAAGVSALLSMADAEGRARTILMDVGWDVEYMDGVFRREGVDRLLADGKIDFVYITHEHVDHFWGMPAVHILDVPAHVHQDRPGAPFRIRHGQEGRDPGGVPRRPLHVELVCG